MAPRRLGLATLALLLAAAPFAAPWIKLFLILTLAKGLAVLGVIVLLQAGQVSFGHALFFCFSAYICAFAGRTLGGGELVSLLLVSALGAGLLGLAVGLFVVRYRYIFFGMLNLAFSMVFFSILEKFTNLTGGSDGIRIRRPSVLGVAVERAQFEWALYAAVTVFALASAFAVSRYFASPPGEMLRAIKSNETRLEYVGASAKRVLLAAYVVSAVLCGLGGAVTALVQGLATPDFGFWTRSGELVFIAIRGGSGYVAGAFVGAALFEGLRSGAAVFFSDAWQLTLGVALLLIVIYAPEGVCGLVAKYWRRGSAGASEAGGSL